MEKKSRDDFYFTIYIYIGLSPLPRMPVTTRIIMFLVADPNLNLHLPPLLHCLSFTNGWLLWTSRPLRVSIIFLVGIQTHHAQQSMNHWQTSGVSCHTCLEVAYYPLHSYTIPIYHMFHHGNLRYPPQEIRPY